MAKDVNLIFRMIDQFTLQEGIFECQLNQLN